MGIESGQTHHNVALADVIVAPDRSDAQVTRDNSDTMRDEVRSGTRTLIGLLIITILVVIVAWGVLPGILPRLASSNSEPTTQFVTVPPDGAVLYVQNCAHCHGVRGDGAGPIANGVYPRPRNFGEGKFRLKTTATGAPIDDDLLAVIRHGIPGSAMPAFTTFSDAEARAIVAHVRSLSRAGIYERLRRKMEADGDDADPAQLHELTDRQAQVGPVIDIPKKFPAATQKSLANGRRLYESVCAACHGMGGRGDGQQVAQLKNDDGMPTRPRDFTQGVFKGGSEAKDLYARIVAGMPGSPMPASKIRKAEEPPTEGMTQEEVGDLINYLLTFSKPAGSGAVAAAVNP